MKQNQKFHFPTFLYLINSYFVSSLLSSSSQLLYPSTVYNLKIYFFSLFNSIEKKSVQCILSAVICLAITVSSLDFQLKEADIVVGNDTLENYNQTEFLSPFASVIPLNKTRQERIHVFRPLFVYRQEQLEKQRIHNKNPDRNTVVKNPKPPAPIPTQPPQNHYGYYNQTPTFYPHQHPFYPYPTYNSYPSSSYPSYYSPQQSPTYYSSSYYAGWPSTAASYYSPQPSPTYYPSSYYTDWPSTATGHINDYYASKGYHSNGAASNVWPTSSVSSYYAPQTAPITYTYPAVWQRK